jgi:hypothetical protein
MLMATELMNNMLTFWVKHEKLEGIKRDAHERFENEFLKIFYRPDDEKINGK